MDRDHLATPLVPSTVYRRNRLSHGSFCLFLTTAVLSSALISPGLYLTLKPDNTACDSYFLLWFQGQSCLNTLAMCVLLFQFLIPRESKDHYWLLSMLPAPLFVIEVVMDLVGVMLLAAAPYTMKCSVLCIPAVIMSLLKQWLHCFYCSTVLSQGYSHYGLHLCYFPPTNIYSPCPICQQTITPGQEISLQKCPKSHLFHLKCREKAGICPYCIEVST